MLILDDINDKIKSEIKNGNLILNYKKKDTK